MSSETPRTDAVALVDAAVIEDGLYVPIDFARQLERELAAVTAERDRYRGADEKQARIIADMKAALMENDRWALDQQEFSHD